MDVFECVYMCIYVGVCMYVYVVDVYVVDVLLYVCVCSGCTIVCMCM